MSISKVFPFQMLLDFQLCVVLAKMYSFTVLCGCTNFQKIPLLLLPRENPLFFSTIFESYPRFCFVSFAHYFFGERLDEHLAGCRLNVVFLKM